MVLSHVILFVIVLVTALSPNYYVLITLRFLTGVVAEVRIKLYAILYVSHECMQTLQAEKDIFKNQKWNECLVHLVQEHSQISKYFEI